MCFICLVLFAVHINPIDKAMAGWSQYLALPKSLFILTHGATSVQESRAVLFYA